MQVDPSNVLATSMDYFLRLFDCQDLKSAVPAMAAVHRQLTEKRNLVRALASVLGLPENAMGGEIMRRVRQLLDDKVADLDLRPDYSDMLRGSWLYSGPIVATVVELS